jgi:acid phosphatase class B
MEGYTDYNELKRQFRYEFRIDRGYSSLSLDDMHSRRGNYVFDLSFCLGFKTYVFCDRAVDDTRAEVFKIKKITTINFNGTVSEFDTIDRLVQYISELEEVEEIYGY